MDTNSKSDEMFMAIRSSDVGTLKSLLQQGIDVRAQDWGNTSDGTPYGRPDPHIWDVVFALRPEPYEIVKCLLDYNVPLDAALSTRPLIIWAAALGFSRSVVLFADYGCPINGVDDMGMRALHYAAQYCSLAAIQCLVEHGAEVNCLDDYGFTPLYLATNHRSADGKDEVTAYLTKVGGVIHVPGPPKFHWHNPFLDLPHD